MERYGTDNGSMFTRQSLQNVSIDSVEYA